MTDIASFPGPLDLAQLEEYVGRLREMEVELGMPFAVRKVAHAKVYRRAALLIIQGMVGRELRREMPRERTDGRPFLGEFAHWFIQLSELEEALAGCPAHDGETLHELEGAVDLAWRAIEDVAKEARMGRSEATDSLPH